MRGSSLKPTILILNSNGLTDGQLEGCLEALSIDYQPLVVRQSGKPVSPKLEAKGILTASCCWGYGRSWNILRHASSAARDIIQLIEHHRVRLIYVVGSGALPAASLAARYTHRPLVFYLQCPLRGWMNILVTAQFAGLAERILVASHDLQKTLLRFNRKLCSKIEVCDAKAEPTRYMCRLRELVMSFKG